MASLGRRVPRMSKSALREKRGMLLCETWKIVRGDTVMITTGKDKGLTGTVTKVIRDPYNPRVLVEGRNMVWKHVKMGEDNQEGGGKIRIAAPIQYSNVMLIDPESGGPVRTVIRETETGERVRVSKGKHATGSIIPRPEVLTQRRSPRNAAAGPKDTAEEAARRVTYDPERLVEDFRSFAAKVLGAPTYPRFKTPPLALEDRPTRNRTGQHQGLLPPAAAAALQQAEQQDSLPEKEQ